MSMQDSFLPGITSFAAVLLPRLQVRKVLLSFLRLSPYPPIKKAHHGDRTVEGRDGRPESDVMVRFDELYVTFVFGNCTLTFDVRPAVDPRRPQQEANTPRASAIIKLIFT